MVDRVEEHLGLQDVQRSICEATGYQIPIKLLAMVFPSILRSEKALRKRMEFKGDKALGWVVGVTKLLGELERLAANHDRSSESLRGVVDSLAKSIRRIVSNKEILLRFQR